MFVKTNFQVSQEVKSGFNWKDSTRKEFVMKFIIYTSLIAFLIILSACNSVQAPAATDLESDFPQIDLSLAEQELDELAPQMLYLFRFNS